MQPGWVKKVVAQQQAQLRALDNQPTLSVPYAKRTPGWIFIKEEISSIPDALYPWDPKVVKAIKEITPDIVPIWTKRIYRTPYNDAQEEVVVFGRHGLAQRTRYSPVQHFACPLPSAVSMVKPNSIYWVPWGAADVRARDLPGAYVPFDWRFYKHVKNNFRDIDIKEYKNSVLASIYEHERATEKAQAEFGRMQDEHQKYVNKKMASISDNEMRDHFLSNLNKQKR